MVVQNTINNLKDKPKEEKTAIAGGIAITVVALLLVGWGFWFVKKIQRGEEFQSFLGSKQDEFNPDGVLQAQKDLEEQWKQSQEQLRALRDIPGSNTTQTPTEAPPPEPGTDQFGGPDDGSF